jgi:SAM-dependent methyltransferase
MNRKVIAVTQEIERRAKTDVQQIERRARTDVQHVERRASVDVLAELVRLDGAEVVDVGCGNGWLTREMTRRGAHVVGVEISPRQLSLARQVPPVGDEQYLQASADELQFANRSVDVVVYFNSLHHVDQANLPRALREAARILKHGGCLYISEPLAEGPYFELLKIVHDETAVRRNAQEALRHGPEYGLLLERQLIHLDEVMLEDFGAFHDRLTAINPEVRARFDEDEPRLREAFETLGHRTADGWAFDQPYKVALLRRS